MINTYYSYNYLIYIIINIISSPLYRPCIATTIYATLLAGRKILLLIYSVN